MFGSARSEHRKGVSTQSGFEEGSVAVEEEEGEPEEQEPEGGVGEGGGGAALFGQTVDEGVDGALPDAAAARAVDFGE